MPVSMSDFSRKRCIFAGKKGVNRVVMYYSRDIDGYLWQWKDDKSHKPLLLRGARQVGKSSAIRHLGKEFKYFLEVNFERDRDVVWLR